MLEVKVSRASPATPQILVVRSTYDEGIINAIKAVPGRVWNKPNHVWMIPATPENITALKAGLPRYAKLLVETQLLTELEAQTAAIVDAQKVRDAGDSSIDFPFVTSPYAHQRAGLEFLAKLGSGALLWEMGLGKTKTAIDYAEWIARDIPGGGRIGTKILVICPNTVKRNWAREIEKHAGHRDFDIPEGTLLQRAAGFARNMYTIVNCEQLSHATTAIALQRVNWDLVIVDESTRFKTPGARRTKALHKLRAKRRVILTGTPITGKPEDAWSQIEFISPGLFGTFYAFRDKYIKMDFFKKPVGLKPGTEDDLTGRIGRRSYRILKADVLDLPPKVYSERSVTLAGDQAKAYQQMKDDLRVEIEGSPEFTAHNILTMLLRLTQITAGMIGTSEDGYTWLDAAKNAKLAELDDLLNDELAGEQVVIFGQYQRELEELAARYTPGALVPVRAMRIPGGIVHGSFGKAIDPAARLPIIYGPTPEAERASIIEEFQRGDRRLIFCQNRTGGIGIDLYAAQTAIFYTRSWSLEEWLQTQDRLHRIGQTGTVSILSLIAEKTIDVEISKALSEKQNVADYLTGDKARRLAARLLGG